MTGGDDARQPDPAETGPKKPQTRTTRKATTPKKPEPAPKATGEGLAATIKDVHIDNLEVHPHNPRRGKIEAIAENIRETGWHGVIVADRTTRLVVVGNHRLQAAKLAGMTTVPVQWIDADNEEHQQRKLIGDNRASDIAEWDAAALQAALRLLEQTPRALTGTGFADADLIGLAAMQAADDFDADDYAPPEPDEDPFGFAETPDPDAPPDPRGRVVEAVAFKLADPDTVPAARSTWRIGPHIVAVMHPAIDTDRWRPLLGPEPPLGRTLMPWAGPAMIFAPHLAGRPLLVLQPDPYIAGWVLAALAADNDTAPEAHDHTTDPDPLQEATP